MQSKCVIARISKQKSYGKNIKAKIEMKDDKVKLSRQECHNTGSNHDVFANVEVRYMKTDVS